MKNKTKAVQRSLNYLRGNGWQAAIVERWIPPRGKMKFGVRIDVWGFGDILACKPSTNSFAIVQTFPLARWKDHTLKLSAIPELQVWKKCGGVVLIHGWALKPKNGVRGTKKTWQLREETL